MPHWTFDQHLQTMRDQNVRFSPRVGQGTRHFPLMDPCGKPIQRDPASERLEIESYLSNQSAEHLRLLERLADELPAMHAKCRLAVLLPCRNEAQHIQDRLNLMAEQFGADGRLLDRDLYEVIVLVNNAADENVDSTAELARLWRNPTGMNLSVIQMVHAVDESAPLTLARKILADLALLRASRRNVYSNPLYLVSEDADVVWNDPRQLSEMLNAFDAQPAIDGIRGYQDRCPWLLIDHPIVLLMRRSWNFCESYASSRALRPDRNPQYQFNWNRRVTSGWNSAFTADIYARIGGYNRFRKFEEDLDIGEKISTLRAYETSKGMIPQVNTVIGLPIRAEASPRRWYYRTAKGIEPYDDRNGYENFFAQEHEQFLKSKSLNELSQAIAPFSSLDPANIPLLEDMLQKDFEFLCRLHGSELLATRAYQRILSWLGFESSHTDIRDGQVFVRSLEGVRRTIDQFAARTPKKPVSHLDQVLKAPRRSCPIRPI